MNANQKIAVAGATGRVGRHVVDVLAERGYEVVPISRSHGVDVVTGAGLADALAGVTSVVDTATGASPDQDEATAFFAAETRNLQEAGARAGVERMVVVSIIGIDRFTGGYNAAKRAHEAAMTTGPVPTRILRAAQFHEFVGQLADWGRQGDVAYVPDMRTQVVAARTVAEALADMVTDSSWPEEAAGNGGAPPAEIAGPREERLVELARLLTARRGDPIRVEVGSNPVDADRDLYGSGVLLPGPHATLAGPTFVEWLDATS